MIKQNTCRVKAEYTYHVRAEYTYRVKAEYTYLLKHNTYRVKAEYTYRVIAEYTYRVRAECTCRVVIKSTFILACSGPGLFCFQFSLHLVSALWLPAML